MQSVNSFLQTYQDGNLVLTPTISYRVRTLIEEIHRLRHAQFSDPNFEDGTPKLFYNVGWAMSDNIAKHTLIGTKDIQLMSTNRSGFKIAPFIKFALKDYLKNTIFVDIVDEAKKEMTDVGHVVWKIQDGVPKVVSLLNLVVPPGLDSLQDGSFVEKIEMNYEQMLQKKEDWKEQWADILTLWAYMQSTGKSLFTIYEFWHRDEYDGEGNGWFKGCSTYLDRSCLPDDTQKSIPTWSPQLLLEEYKSPHSRDIRSKTLQKKMGARTELIYPYVERRLFKLKGRWFGVGLYELIRGILEHINMNWNLKRKFDELQFRGILVHKQPSMGAERTLTQQQLESLPSGGILDVMNDEDLHRLDLGTITYDALSTNDALVQLVKMILGVSENIAGEGIKSNVTAAAINANVNLAETTYAVVIKQMGLMLRETFQDFLLEDILTDMTMEDALLITGDPKELIQLEQPLIDQKVNTEMMTLMSAGLFVTEEMVDARRAQITAEVQQTGGVRWMQLPKDLLRLVHFSVDFIVDGENFDKAATINSVEMMLNRDSLTLNREELEKTELDLLGLDSKRLQLTPEEKAAARQQQIQDSIVAKSMPTP